MPFAIIGAEMKSLGQAPVVPHYLFADAGNKAFDRYMRSRFKLIISTGKASSDISNYKLMRSGLDSIGFDTKGVTGSARPLIQFKFKRGEFSLSELLRELKIEYRLPSLTEDEEPAWVLECDGEPQVITDLAR